MKGYWFGRWIEIKLLVGLMFVNFGEDGEEKRIVKFFYVKEKKELFIIFGCSSF